MKTKKKCDSYEVIFDSAFFVVRESTGFRSVIPHWIFRTAQADADALNAEKDESKRSEIEKRM